MIDGQQRIQTVVYYIDGYFGRESTTGRNQIFRLKGLDERSPYHNKKFDELSETEQRRLKGSVLRAINVRQLSPVNQNNSIYYIFERLNTGGVALKPQEIRNCVYSGPFSNTLKELNTNEHWRAIVGRKSLDRHQRDVELLLRLFALSGRWREYERPMKEFLNIAMKDSRNATTGKTAKFVREFKRAAKLVQDELGEKPFHIRGPLNTAVLDSILGTIIGHRTRLRNDWPKRAKQLFEDPGFLESTRSSTADESAVRGRFGLAEKALLSR